MRVVSLSMVLLLPTTPSNEFPDLGNIEERVKHCWSILQLWPSLFFFYPLEGSALLFSTVPRSRSFLEKPFVGVTDVKAPVS